MANIPDPITRKDQYLSYLTGNTDYYPTDPITREEKYLFYLCENGGIGGGSVTPEQIQQAVDAYLEENPVQPGATVEQVAQIEKNKADISELSEVIEIERKGINAGYDYELMFNFEVGSFISTTGENTENSTRIRTSEFYHPNKDRTSPIIVYDGFQCFIQEFSYKSEAESYEPTGNSGFGEWIIKNTSVAFSHEYFYKIMIRKNIDDPIDDPMSMANKVIFGSISEINYVPESIKKNIYANKKDIEIPIEWELGGINGGDGTNVENNTRIRTKNWISFDNMESVTIEWRIGQIYILRRSKRNLASEVVSSWLSQQTYSLSIDQNYEYRFMYQYVGNADIYWQNRIKFYYNGSIDFNSYVSIDNRESKKMKVVTMGDSMFLDGNDRDIYSWQNVMNDYFDFKELISVGIGGSGFTWIDSRKYDMPLDHVLGRNLPSNSVVSEEAVHNSAFCSWYRILNTIPKDADLIIVGTGINDFGGSDIEEDLSDMEFVSNSNIDTEWANSEYYSVFNGDYDITKRRGAMLSTIMKLQFQAPHAKIVFINFPNTRLRDGTGENSVSIENLAYQKSVLDAMEYVHKMWGIPLIDLFGTSGINPLNRAKYTIDSIHCNPLGYSSMFANAVIAGLKPILNNGIYY